MTHWAAKYIGLPWSEDRNCWWLVREVFRDRWGIDMPVIGVGEQLHLGENVTAIKEAATKSGWRPVQGEPEDGDILLCRDMTRRRHVGMMVLDAGRLMFLHNDGHMTARGPVGSVVAQTLRDAVAGGMSEIELWRRA